MSTPAQKITYATLGSSNLDTFHAAFDLAVDRVREGFGGDHAQLIHGAWKSTSGTFEKRSPIDTGMLLGRFATCDEALVEDAIASARSAWPAWRDTPWQERVAILERAAALIVERKYELSALMCFEVGKNRLEAMGEVEESADLIRYYCKQMVDSNGFLHPMSSPTPKEETQSILRPFGVWAVICPFNFPLALSAGPAAGALAAGNTVVLKPASDTPLSAVRLAEIFNEAGLPAGTCNLVTGSGDVFGRVITRRNGVDGILFTGSKAVGMQLYNTFSQEFPRPCILEMGGKNPAIVTAAADLDKASDGIMRSAFGMGGQKCSACSRAYVHAGVYDAFLEQLVTKTGRLVLGDPSLRDVYLGPVINQAAVTRYEQAAALAAKDGRLAWGGSRLQGGPLVHGWFVEPTIVTDLPERHALLADELFLPFLALAKVGSLDEAIGLSNEVPYGLTAGIYSEDAAEVEHFFNTIESGVLYANRRTGATTGAWPGVQSFCGWKGSGSSGKGGCGPYYVMQFMREQSRTNQR